MSLSRSDATAASPGPRVVVAIPLAAATRVATLPGRSHGLGLVTEPLLADLGIERVAFATLNFWATLLGAIFCLPVGRLVDRCGQAMVLAGSLATLGVVVVVLSMVRAAPATIPLPGIALSGDSDDGFTVAVPALLFLLVLLTRGLGQSGLSVVSLALLGRAAGDRPGRLVGTYSCLVAVGFMAWSRSRHRRAVGSPYLGGPAAVVQFVPQQDEPSALVERAGFEGVSLLKFDAQPCFTAGGIAMREMQLEAFARSR